MDLKDYQKRTLNRLALFLAQAHVKSPAAAFNATAKKNANGNRASYLPILGKNKAPLPTLKSVPYVAIRIPTGGSKTVLGTHIIHHTAKVFLKRSHPMVLWLVPSKLIKTQTLKAFRNSKHPYRRKLNAKFSINKVAMFNIANHGKFARKTWQISWCSSSAPWHQPT